MEGRVAAVLRHLKGIGGGDDANNRGSGAREVATPKTARTMLRELEDQETRARVPGPCRAPSHELLHLTFFVSAPARCRPWSREDFLARVGCAGRRPRWHARAGDNGRLRRLFSITSWFGKPKVASPLECARRGWVLEGKDLLRCSNCDARLAYRITSAPGTDAHRKALEHFVARMHEAHAEACGWRDESCSPDYASVRVPGTRDATAQARDG